MPMMLTQIQQCRQVLLVVAELHRLGYERIRIAPYIDDSPGGGVWKCEIVPAALISRQHGAFLANPNAALSDADFPHYNSRHWRAPNLWVCVAVAEAAQNLLRDYPELVRQGGGRDPDYVDWFRQMLVTTEPEAVVYATAWWDQADPTSLGSLRVFPNADAQAVPLPPPPVT